MIKKIVYVPVKVEGEYTVPSWNGPLKREELYTFTEEELNQYTESVIKKALEIAAEKALLAIDGIVEKPNGQKYIVEEGNHYCETEIDIDKQSIINTFGKVYKNFKV